MNIAFGAVIIFILLLPPITFYVAFNHGRFQKGTPRISLLEMLMISAIFAMLVHSIGILLIRHDIRFDILLLLIAGNVETAIKQSNNSSFEDYMQQFAAYNFTQLMVAAATGKFCRWFLLRKKLHTKIESFRLYNHWWYLFNQHKKTPRDRINTNAEFDIVFLDVLVNTSAGAVLYSGYLTDFICQGETLERVYLSGTKKQAFNVASSAESRKIKKQPDKGSKRIDGIILSIPASEIVNINVNFLGLSSAAKTNSIPGGNSA